MNAEISVELDNKGLNNICENGNTISGLYKFFFFLLNHRVKVLSLHFQTLNFFFSVLSFWHCTTNTNQV